MALIVIAAELAVLAAATSSHAQPEPAATAAFNAYVGKVDTRIQTQHRAADSFLAGVPSNEAQQLQTGKPVIEQLTPEDGAELPGALLHHWRGTIFLRGATAAGFDHLLRDFPAYPRIFAPQVTRAAILSGGGDHVHTRVRLVQHHVLTVVLDTAYDVSFGQPNPQHRWSTSHSTRISEVQDPGTAREQAFSPTQSHGFLWRLDTWWTWEQADGGLYIQVESVSLTRAIPAGLGWAVRPFIQSIPRESLEFTLTAAANALQKQERASR